MLIGFAPISARAAQKFDNPLSYSETTKKALAANLVASCKSKYDELPMKLNDNSASRVATFNKTQALLEQDKMARFDGFPWGNYNKCLVRARLKQLENGVLPVSGQATQIIAEASEDEKIDDPLSYSDPTKKAFAADLAASCKSEYGPAEKVWRADWSINATPMNYTFHNKAVLIEMRADYAARLSDGYAKYHMCLIDARLRQLASGVLPGRALQTPLSPSVAQPSLASVARPRAAPYVGVIRPVYDAIDEHYYWTAADGCNIKREKTLPQDLATRPYRIEWQGACEQGWASGQGTLLWFSGGGLNSIASGVFSAGGGLKDGSIYWIGLSVENREPKSIYLTQYANSKRTSQKKLEPGHAPIELNRSFDLKVQQFTAANPSANASEEADTGNRAWFTNEEKKDVREFFVELLTGVAALAEQKAAQKQAKKTAQAYDRHRSGSRPNTMAHYNEGARLLGEKERAESERKKVVTKLARAGKYMAPNREISGAVKSRGTEAPTGRSCLAKYDEVRMDRKTRELLERGEEVELSFINLCRDVRIDVFLCMYRAGEETGNYPGKCMVNSEDTVSTVSYEQTYVYHLDPAFKNQRGEHHAYAFCPKGSSPTEFEAFSHTQRIGNAKYKCVWN